MQAILIDVTAREIRAVEYEGLPDLQKLVGGYIEAARSWDSGDVLFVDEEGLFKPKDGFFRIDGVEQPLAGNGLLVGAERYDSEGEYVGTDAPRLTVEQLAAMVRFLSRHEADAWAKANASEPAVSFTTFGPGSPPETTVFARYGRLFGDMPRKPEKPE